MMAGKGRERRARTAGAWKAARYGIPAGILEEAGRVALNNSIENYSALL
jgi:hypothetical protein